MKIATPRAYQSLLFLVAVIIIIHIFITIMFIHSCLELLQRVLLLLVVIFLVLKPLGEDEVGHRHLIAKFLVR